jgi:hypothetical protein
MTESRSLHWVPWVVLLGVVLLACGCWGAFKALAYDMNKPPEITAEYRSGEAILVMEDLAGEIIAEVAKETGSSPFTHRSWETQPCTSGWDGRTVWDGYVSAGVSYEFPRTTDDDVTSVDYGEHIADAIKSLGMEPEVESEGQKTVRAERDDGLMIDFYSDFGLSIRSGCIVEGEPYEYTPPYGNVPPPNDYIHVGIQ